MMFKCCDCGHLFEDGERKTILTDYGVHDGFYDTVYVCPVCNGNFEEVFQCKKCGEWHTQDELYDGWCEKCLRETINYDTFFKYCEANKDEQYLDIFVMSELLGGMDCPKNVSYEFHQLMIDVYKEMVNDIKSAMTASYKAVIDILPACIRFIMDDDGSIGRENYADWLNKKGVR